MGGLAILVLVHVSLVFLLVSPFIENPFGRDADARFLAGLDKRIHQLRTAPLKVTFTDADGNPLAGQRIRYRLARHDFHFGCNFFEFDGFANPEYNRLYKRYFADLFNLAVLPFYWRRYEPQEGSFPTNDRLENMLDFCEQNAITPKGHPLAWRNPSGYPHWLPEQDEKVVALLEKRIRREVARYSDRIPIWDVVNEPTHLPTFGGQDRFDYVRRALEWAREARGENDARLTVNDYGILGHDFGSGPYFELMNRLVASGAPLEIIGFETHEPRTDWIPAVEIWESLEAYAGIGLPIHLTEFTVPSSALPVTNSWIKGLWTEDRQAEYLERFYKTCFAHPSVGALIYWDLYDGRSWIKTGGLIDASWRPKPAYRRLEQLIKKEWHTQGTAVTDAGGSIGFRGFFGSYHFVLEETGREAIARLARDATGQTVQFAE
jgi:GH35 family endo-1,4-beta-xylanase